MHGSICTKYRSGVTLKCFCSAVRNAVPGRRGIQRSRQLSASPGSQSSLCGSKTPLDSRSPGRICAVSGCRTNLCSCRTPESSGFCSKSAGSASPAIKWKDCSSKLRASERGAFVQVEGQGFCEQAQSSAETKKQRVSAPNSQRAFVSALQRLA